jgi:hypothetical protein
VYIAPDDLEDALKPGPRPLATLGVEEAVAAAVVAVLQVLAIAAAAAVAAAPEVRTASRS